MKPEAGSLNLLSITRSRAKMYEYDVPYESFISLPKDPKELFVLTIGILGDFSSPLSNDSHEELRQSMLFTAQYFDAYISSRLNQPLDNYLLLLGSAAYYLCDLPGSSYVLINNLDYTLGDIGSEELEYLLISMLRKDFANVPSLRGEYKTEIEVINNACQKFLLYGTSQNDITNWIELLRDNIYYEGNDRQLLLIDTIRNVIQKFFHNSSWNLLPVFSGMEPSQWDLIIRKPNFIKELWPAQILLGEKDVYNGKSAVIQMPTSAGKTKSIEIIIRSSFLSSRANVAVIVAPFKALCNEIKTTLQEAFANEQVKIDVPTDAFQIDFDIFSEIELETEKLILILTPEKFIYMMRHAPEIVDEVGLLIYDEGHQFDNGIRGVTYELLLSSLRLLIPRSTQIILISAVIMNAHSIGDWLIGDNKAIVNGANLLPTYRTIGFVSWRDSLGRIEFVNPENPDIDEFYVPRIIYPVNLAKLGRERTTRTFPIKGDGKSVAVFLGLKLVKNGAVAIFCGAKPTVKGIGETIHDLYERQYPIRWPSSYSETSEINRLKYLHLQHFGASHSLTNNCELGVFSHSGNTPQGIRLSIEYAMQKGKIKFLICTSTLAQGVNLPIKYLMVTSFYQAQDQIKTRDFHNLIGRAGRSGIHTEGSIIFTDNEIFDRKAFNNDSYSWNLAKGLLNPAQAEPCTSTILNIFDRIISEDKKYELTLDPIELVVAYISGPETVREMLNGINQRYANRNFTLPTLIRQTNYKLRIIAAIESYLMAHWENADLGTDIGGVEALAKATLGYFSGDAEQRAKIIDLFIKLAKNVEGKISTDARKKSYGKTLFGVQDIKDIEAWVIANSAAILLANNEDELLDFLWPILMMKIDHGNLAKLAPTAQHIVFAKIWMTGKAYVAMLETLQATGAYMIWGTRQRQLDQEFIIDIGEGAFGYDSTLIVAAVVEVLKTHIEDIDDHFYNLADLLQKRLKYGLPDALTISFYEIGFADRVLAIELAKTFPLYSAYRPALIHEIKRNKEQVVKVLEKFPSYFENVLNSL